MHLTVLAGIVQQAKERGETEEDAIMAAHQYVKALPLPQHEQDYAMQEVRTIAAKLFEPSPAIAG
jgi:hypothetical protein